MTGVALLVAATLASSAGAPSATTPQRPALTASPSRVVLDGTARAEVRLAVPRGVELVGVALAPYALDLRGRARLGGAARAPRWVSARPSSLSVGPRGAVVQLAAAPPRGTTPGDRPFALVLTTGGSRRGGVEVRLRIGVLVIAHVPGPAVRKLVIGPLLVRRAGRARILELTVRNTGNVLERLPAGGLVLAVLRHGRVAARLRPPGRMLLPHSRALVAARLPRPLRAPAAVRVTFGAFVHVYPLRL